MIPFAQPRRAIAGVLVLAFLSIPAGSASAQVASRPGLTLDGARQAIAAGMAYARKNGAPGGVIAVVDEGGNLMAVERLDGTFAAGASISIGKARTAALFRKPTRFFEDVVNKGRTAMTALPDFTPLQGGVPILSGAAIVGAVGVSGAASAQQDEEIALAAAAAVAAGAPAVSYYDRATVDAAFAKGAVLFDGAGDRNYMVHASRRDKAGMAEVHSADTDVIYVLDGSATFVTGGSVEGGHEVEPGELRGTAIAGGDTRQIAKGDVLIVPAGVPHWFRQVPGVLTYYVVKVRR
jgi:glc operon protein GlcG